MVKSKPFSGTTKAVSELALSTEEKEIARSYVKP
jgi:hypothetical protein